MTEMYVRVCVKLGAYTGQWKRAVAEKPRTILHNTRNGLSVRRTASIRCGRIWRSEAK